MGFNFPIKNLRQFLEILRKQDEVVDIYEPVDPYLEIAEIHRRIAAGGGPVLFFHNVRNSSFPVVTNLFGSPRRVELAFPHHPEKIVSQLIELIQGPFPPSLKTLWKKRSTLFSLKKIGTWKQWLNPIEEKEISPPDLEKLPFLTTWPLDGGPFLTLPLVYTEPVGKGAPNLGMYRIQRFGKRETGLHFQIGKGGGFHYHQAEEKNQPLPVTIFLGGPPALIFSAIAPLPENLSELLLCSFLQGAKLSVTKKKYPHSLISECEFALVGHSPPHIRKPEGPFGDHYGYYSLQHDFPVFHCERIFHRKDAIYPATVVGKPKQEDFYIGDFLQELLSPIFPIVMPSVRSLWSYGETGFHSLAAAVVKERYERECMAAAFRILGEGQLSLTKFLLLTNIAIDVKNFREVLITILERFRPETDLFIFPNLSLDTLDYTGPFLNKGSRGILLGIGEKRRELPAQFSQGLPEPLKEVSIFCPGCLVIEVDSFAKFSDFSILLELKALQNWPLVILVDNAKKTTSSTQEFLWTVFTRFEPAADIHAKFSKVFRHHPIYEGPILIDARMKPTYPPVVECDATTYHTVNQKWDSYFPETIAEAFS